MTFEEAYESLNEEQKAAVDQIEGPVMVLAGPGTGKTQILSLRIARILKETQMNPQNILCLTFTESGVAAMRKRLFEFIGTPAYYVRIHTFHSFCNEVIKEHAELFLFARELEALSDLERVQIYGELFDKLPEKNPLKPFGDPHYYLNAVSNAVKSLKKEDISIQDFKSVLDRMEALLNEHGATIETFTSTDARKITYEHMLDMQNQLAETPFASVFVGEDLEDSKVRTQVKKSLKEEYLKTQKELPKQRVLVELYEAYGKELKKRGRYDYEDMILMVVRKLKENAELLAELQENYQYILVDEYQDTNGAQNEVVNLIASFYENPNVFVVGDDKQSIYRFQGASLENMLSFYYRYKDTLNIITLQSNYRSQQAILDAATKLIGHNERGIETVLPQIQQHLKAEKNLPVLMPRRVEAENSNEEQHFIIDEIERLIKEGVEPKEIAVLYHNHRDVEPLVDRLIRTQVPFQVHAGKDILLDKEILKLLRVLEWIADPAKDDQLFFILHFDFLQLPISEILELTHRAHKEKKPLLSNLANASEKLQAFHRKLESWVAVFHNKTLAESFEILINESGYLAALMQKEDKVKELNRLNTFFDHLKQWNRLNQRATLADFMEYLNLLRENKLSIKENELSTQKNAVALMTAHAAKGLEFEHVFIMQCLDKHWGNVSSQDKLKLPKGLLKTPELLSTERNEDERRLFYVAMTRAKKTLTFTHAKKDEKDRECVPSQFLNEMDLTPEDAPEGQGALVHLERAFQAPQKTTGEDEATYVRGLLQDFQLSVTHLNNYLECPRRFYYGSLLRAPRAKSKEASLGTAVHEALKDFHINLKTNSVEDQGLLLSSFEKNLQKQLLTLKDYESCLGYGREQLEEYFEHYKDRFAKDTLMEFSFKPHGVHVEGVPITGQLDKIEVVDENNKCVHVVDFKTGNPDNKSSDLGPDGGYRRQIIFYQLLCDSSTQFPYKMVSGEIDFIQKSKKNGDFVRRRFEVTEAEKEQLKTQIKAVYEDIMNLEFLNPNPDSLCGECEWCLGLT